MCGVLVLLAALGVGMVDAAAGDPAQLPGAGGTLWVTNRTGALGSMSVFDAGTGTVIDTFTVGTRPTGVVAPVGTGKVYVSGGSPATPSRSSPRTRSR